jgi:GTP1/Obg family GTP-binding protein
MEANEKHKGMSLVELVRQVFEARERTSEEKEKQLIAKIVRIRDERSRLRLAQKELSDHLDEIDRLTNQLY